MKDFIVVSWHGVKDKFKTPIELKMKLLSSLYEHLPPSCEIDSFEVGYMEGRRQTKRRIVSTKDMKNMYKNVPNDDLEILLWCDGKDVSHKRYCVQEPNADRPVPKRSNLANSSHEEDIEDITQEFSSAHGDKYSYAQYKLWARMIMNKQHNDKDNPPNILMIVGKPEKKSKKDFDECLADCAVAIVKALQAPAVPTSLANAPPVAFAQPQPTAQGLHDGISPGKKVNLRAQYLSQLKTLQTLRDDGVLTSHEFQVKKSK